MDVYDVYEQLEQAILGELQRLITEHGEKPPFEFYPIIFRYITENPKIFKMIFSPHNTSMIYSKLLELVEKLNMQIWTRRFGIDPSNTAAEYVIRYHSNGCLAIIATWIMRDYDLPREFIIKTISALDENTEKHMITLKNNGGA